MRFIAQQNSGPLPGDYFKYSVLDRNTIYSTHTDGYKAHAEADRLNRLHNALYLRACIDYFAPCIGYLCLITAFLYIALQLLSVEPFLAAITGTSFFLFWLITLTLSLIFKDFPDERL